MFTLDIYTPMRARAVGDKEAVRVAMIASVVIAVFSFFVAPLLSFAPEGLWQIIRIFTGFYNIPIIAIVLVGLFTRYTPAIGAKIVIGFHIIAYGLLKFVFDDIVTLHFLHLYAILFAIEVGIMLIAGRLAPRETPWTFQRQEKVDLTPWRLARPVAVTLLSLVVALYVIFSPIGLASGQPGLTMYALLAGLLAIDVAAWMGLRTPARPGPQEART
jgi:SSS family solute:Na+ symporter